MNKIVNLPSGAKLEVQLAPFADCKALYQALCEEAKGLKLDPKADVDVNLWKDLFVYSLSSKRVEECLWVCMKRSTYNGIRITEETFEPEAARDDYLMVCFEVGKTSVFPFVKSLYAKFSPILETLVKALA